MKQQTAVDWLQSEINKYIDYYEGKRDAMPYSLTHLQNAILQAKKMEKKQIMNAYKCGKLEINRVQYDFPTKEEKHYDETYNQNSKFQFKK